MAWIYCMDLLTITLYMSNINIWTFLACVHTNAVLSLARLLWEHPVRTLPHEFYCVWWRHAFIRKKNLDTFYREERVVRIVVVNRSIAMGRLARSIQSIGRQEMEGDVKITLTFIPKNSNIVPFHSRVAILLRDLYSFHSFLQSASCLRLVHTKNARAH